MTAPERYEQLIAYLDSHLSGERTERGDGSIQFIGGDPPDVVVELTEANVVVSEYAAVWQTPYALTPKPRRVGVIKWQRLPETALFNALNALIKGAREARAGHFRRCDQCGRATAPEWMDTDSTCTSCAEREERRLVH